WAKVWAACLLIWWGAGVSVGRVLSSLIGVVVVGLPIFTTLSSLFVILICIAAVSVGLFAVGYLREQHSTHSAMAISLHGVALVVLFYSMVVIVSAMERYEFLLWWELMTLSSFMLVMFNGHRKEVLHGAVGYFVMMHLSFFFLLIGFSSLPAGELFGSGTMPWWVWLMFLVGFGFKAGLVPLHTWLPTTYSAAPSHVSAIMSGAMSAMGFYGLFRVLMASGDALIFGVTLFVVGCITALFGVIKATMQSDLKRLLAYSSIENMGIAVLALGLGAIGVATGSEALMVCGYGGALIHIMGHSAYKTMLYLSVGAVIFRTKSSAINTLGGLMRRMPITGSIFGVGVLAICSVPPFVGFSSEFTVLSGLFNSIALASNIVVGVIGITVLSLVGGLSLMAFGKAYGLTMLGVSRSQSACKATEVSGVMLCSAVLPLMSVVFGAMAYPYLVLSNSFSLFGVIPTVDTWGVVDNLWVVTLALCVVVVLCLGFIALRFYLQRSRAISSAPTWGCAFAKIDSSMQYTSESLSAELQQTMSYKPLEVDSSRNVFVHQEGQWKEHNKKLVVNFRVRWMRRWSSRLALFQTGRTNHYILHALLFLLLILIISMLGLI
ncbi:MAG: proton-conducting transporter membrane subunit, partial [Mucinivorans sp.]